MRKDLIYKSRRDKIAPFEFNQEVADVFDDMLHRSVPFYREIIQRQADLVCRLYRPDTRIYDLGCSNGNLGVLLCDTMPHPFTMIAVDSSGPMLAAYTRRLDGYSPKNRIHLVCGDIADIRLSAASVIVLNLTLQFLPLAQRQTLMESIYRALLPGGIFLFTEKIIHPDEAFSELQQQVYYDFKRRNGYDELEISQKREALENVLIPETLENHLHRLKRIGFRKTDVWFKWFNFCSLICRKD